MSEPAPFPPALRELILAWYAARGRRLPFRGTSDPYAILVSEAMAQQTQAARAGEAWIRFMGLFPTVSSLAAATPADVLRAWQGLGYNRRALNLWRAARRIVELPGGQVPADLAGLLELPGVGPYTARAVAALAFGLPVGAVDTNVRRVLGRIVAGDAGVALGPSALQAIADAAVPRGRPGEWTHALMDIGATLCRPRRPDCATCPAQRWCRHAAARRTVDTAATILIGMGRRVTRTAAREEPALVGGRASGAEPGRRTGGGPAARAVPVAFTSTSRWLRGRIVEQLRAVRDGEWSVVDGPIGEHDRSAVANALHALAREGLVDLDTTHAGVLGLRARLPIA